MAKSIKNLSKDYLVLEVGSGHNPHERSNILVDRWLYKTDERSNFSIRFDRPLLIASGEKLPFGNKTFDFVFSFQTVEHSKNPKKFLQELSRVGKQGLITCPSAYGERLFGWPHHRWFIIKKDNVLHFYPKNSLTPPFGEFFHELYHQKIFFRKFCLQNDKFLNIHHHYQGKFFFKIYNQTKNKLVSGWDRALIDFLTKIDWGEKDDLSFFLDEFLKRVKRKARKEWRIFFWKTREKFNPEINLKILRKFLCCPICKRGVSYNKKRKALLCARCQEAYPVIKGIPILLDKKERQKGY